MEPGAHAKLPANTRGASLLILGFAGRGQGSNWLWREEHGSHCGPATLHSPVACTSRRGLECPTACDGRSRHHLATPPFLSTPCLVLPTLHASASPPDSVLLLKLLPLTSPGSGQGLLPVCFQVAQL